MQYSILIGLDKVIVPGKTISEEIFSSDAIVLFDDTDLSQWKGAPNKNVLVKGKEMSKFKSSKGGDAKWIITPYIGLPQVIPPHEKGPSHMGMKASPSVSGISGSGNFKILN
jgi:hypothetical protein